MTPDDAPQQSLPEKPAPQRRAGRVWYVVGGFVFVFLGGSGLLWFLRKPVAEQALAAWCAERELECDANFTQLDYSGITVSAVKVNSGGVTPAEAAEVRADIRWTGLFTPEVTGITVNGLSLRGTLDANGLRFGGLERLAQPGGGGGKSPPVEIPDARILLDTPAGQTSATLTVSGTLPRNGTITLRLDPGELANPLARANLREGRLDVRAVDSAVEAEIGLGIREAMIGQFGLEELDLLGRAEFDEDAAKPAAIEWSLRAARIASPDLRASDIRTTGSLDFKSRPDATTASVLAELASAIFTIDASGLTLSGYTFDAATIKGELAGHDGTLSGPLMAEAGMVTGPIGSARALSLAGEMQRRGQDAAGFEGKMSVSGAALDAELRGQAGAAFSLPGVLAGHAAQLRTALDRALSGFDADAEFALQTDGKAFSALASGQGSLKSASGLILTVTPGAFKPWLAVRADEITGQGAIRLSGGGAPSVAMDVLSFSHTPEAVKMAVDTFSLPRWSVGGRILSADLQGMRLDSRAGSLSLAGSGQLSFAGDAGGVTLEPTHIRGGLDAARDSTGWRVQSQGAPCLAVDTEGLTLGAIRLLPADFDICPANGRFMRQGPVPGGTELLGSLSLPFTMESGEGVLKLDNATIDWIADKGFALTARARTLDLPLQLGERTLTILGDGPRIDIVTGKGPAQISARLGETVFGGSLIPANVSAGAFSFDGTSAASGVEGKVAGTGVLITDINADPLYKPVAAEFSGTLGENRLRLTGPLQLQSTGTPLADAKVDLNIIKLDGTASVVTRPLAFRAGDLQPDMISGRLTGLFTDAVGSVSSDARFTITGGTIAGKADVSVQDFGFQTTRLGRVSGINGTVNFADLMALKTAPGQVLNVASVNPGIPLSDGHLVFDLREGGILHLDTVTFPFGGGKLAIAPFDWALDGGLQDQSVAVTADAIDLGRLVEILKLPDTTATGTVSGSFPIVFTDNRVQIKDARLRADDPGGRLSYTGGAVDAAAGQDANASLAFDALRDLKFEVLEVGINGDLAGDLRADLLLIGENINPLPMGNRLTLPAGQAFEFAIGFDLPLGTLIENRLGLISQEDLIDATVELLNDEQVRDGQVPEAAAEPASE